VELSLAGDRVITLREPTVKEFYELDAVFMRLVGETREADEPEDQQRMAKDIGGRWLTHVIAALGDVEREYDSQAMPAWCARNFNQLRDALQEHWLTVPLASGPRSNGSSASTTAPTPMPVSVMDAQALANRFIPGAPIS